MMQQSLVDFLEEACASVRHLEEAAAAAIQQEDAETYRRLMHDKAELLQGLAHRAESKVEALPEALRQWVLQRLNRFSASAGQALQLGSVFYMSALLFPEEHQSGQPNDLENFTIEVRGRLKDA